MPWVRLTSTGRPGAAQRPMLAPRLDWNGAIQVLHPLLVAGGRSVGPPATG